MKLQIDLKPIEYIPDVKGYHMGIYLNGEYYRAVVTKQTADQMVKDGLVTQVYGQREVDGRIERFEYDNKLDGAGVQFTSDVFEIKENP